MALSQVLLQPMNGLLVLPAAKAVKKIGRLSLPQQQTLLDAMSGLERPVDVILVDASMAHPNGFSPFGLASQETVVVLSGSSASITEAYSLIKKVSHAFSRKHFRILVNKVRSQADARSIFENIAQVPGSNTPALFRWMSRYVNPPSCAVQYWCRRRIRPLPVPFVKLPPICFTGNVVMARAAASSISCSNCYT
jgi:MinD-like ATPase involved in chromosome partitioning or flagellar assembly